MGLHLLYIVQYRIGCAGGVLPGLAAAEGEELVRGDEDAQREGFVAAGGFVAQDGLDAEGLQAGGQQFGDFLHVEVALGVAEDADAGVFGLEPGGEGGGFVVGEGVLGGGAEAGAGGFEFGGFGGEQAGDAGGSGEAAALGQAVLDEVCGGVGGLREVVVEVKVGGRIEQTGLGEALVDLGAFAAVAEGEERVGRFV